MKKNDIKDETKPLSLLSLILSFMALIVISTLLFAHIDHESRQILIGLDFVICSIFLFQLGIDLIRSTNKWAFLKRHWIDIVASIPLIEVLRYARILHVFRVIRLIRTRGDVTHQLKTNRKETTLASILLLMISLLTIGASLVFFFEVKDPNANIHTGGDALWWALVTISTVGYGDHYPVTTAGKVLASLIILCGVGIFGMISGLITSILSSPDHKQTLKAENKEKLLIQLVSQQHEILRRIESLESRLSEQPARKENRGAGTPPDKN